MSAEATKTLSARAPATIPMWCAPWIRVATCVAALVFAWLPTAADLGIAVSTRSNPGAAIALGYGLPFMIASWGLGVFAALMRRGDPASTTSERIVLMLAILPVPLFFLRVPVWLASLF